MNFTRNQTTDRDTRAAKAASAAKAAQAAQAAQNAAALAQAAAQNAAVMASSMASNAANSAGTTAQMYARGMGTGVKQGVFSARTWAAPRLDSAADYTTATIAPMVSSALHSTARQVNPVDEMVMAKSTSKSSVMTWSLLGLAVCAAMGAAAAMVRYRYQSAISSDTEPADEDIPVPMDRGPMGAGTMGTGTMGTGTSQPVPGGPMTSSDTTVDTDPATGAQRTTKTTTTTSTTSTATDPNTGTDPNGRDTGTSSNGRVTTTGW